MKKKVEETLIEMGIYPNLSGFDYICKAINYITKDSTAKMCAVYALVANDCGTTSSRVERGIRTTISKIDKGSEAYKKYVGIKETTNSAILYTLAIKLKED